MSFGDKACAKLKRKPNKAINADVKKLRRSYLAMQLFASGYGSRYVNKGMRCGAYRCVICIGKYAIKLPRLTQLAKDLRCNQWENEIWNVWRPIFGWDHLCPIIAVAPSSLFVVMRKANQHVSFAEVKEADDSYDYYPDVPVEYKPENWGKVDGKVVCLDYGIDDINLIEKERAYLESKK